MNGPEHYAEAVAHLATADETPTGNADLPFVLAVAQVHATLAQAAATERLAAAVENLPTYEGMLAVYQFGGGRS